MYLGFFHTGAYQDAISGYGGIKHCLIPSPKHVIIDKDEDGNLIAITSMSKPLKKTINDEFTFKMKLDL